MLIEVDLQDSLLQIILLRCLRPLLPRKRHFRGSSPAFALFLGFPPRGNRTKGELIVTNTMGIIMLNWALDII
jgi:hypothetical protein